MDTRLRPIAWLSAVLCLAATAACTVVDPLYCDESHPCTDPERPFCDLEGEFPESDGVDRTCIADPSVGDGGDDEGGDGGGGETGAFSITAAAERLFVRQGESASVDVTVTRDDDFREPITVALDGLPDGVTADPVTVEVSETSTSLTITAEGGATQGALELEVSAAAGELVRTSPLRLVVAGSAGTLDSSFGTGGKLTHRFGDGDSIGGNVAIQEDGKLVVAGFVFDNPASTQQAFAIRVDAAGALDDSFGSGGAATPGIGQASTHETVASLRGGRILAGGTLSQPGTDLTIFAYTPEGDLDTTFGMNGTAALEQVLPGGSAGVARILELEDDAILAVGAASQGSGTPLLRVARLSAEGNLDSGFDISEPLLEPKTALLDREGRLLVAGQKSGKEFPSFIARYLPDGTLDATFGEGGVVEANVSTTVEEVTGLVQLEDGKLLAIGHAGTDGTVTLARYSAAGVPDLTFGDGGTISAAIGLVTTNGAILDEQGRVIVAGRSSSLPTVARFLPSGALDRSFGDAGMAVVNFGIAGDSASGANGAAIDSDGRIVVSGAVGGAGTRSVAMARLWP
jgi:uncharacterized delta-60 repeat protein